MSPSKVSMLGNSECSGVAAILRPSGSSRTRVNVVIVCSSNAEEGELSREANCSCSVDGWLATYESVPRFARVSLCSEEVDSSYMLTHMCTVESMYVSFECMEECTEVATSD